MFTQFHTEIIHQRKAIFFLQDRLPLSSKSLAERDKIFGVPSIHIHCLTQLFCTITNHTHEVERFCGSTAILNLFMKFIYFSLTASSIGIAVVIES